MGGKGESTGTERLGKQIEDSVASGSEKKLGTYKTAA